MIIGIDCDEVLAETLDQILETPFFKEKNIHRTDIHSYDLRENKQLPITVEEGIDLFFWFFESKEFRNTKPVIGAKEKLQEWKNQGHTLVVITGRPLAFKEKTIEWINQYFPNIFDDYLFAGAYTDQEISKSELCKQRGIEVVVEDNLMFVKDLSQHHIPCFLIDKPRNKSYTSQEYPGVIKVLSRDTIDLSLLPSHYA